MKHSENSKHIGRVPVCETESWIKRNENCRALGLSHLFQGFVPSKARGIYITDVDGRQYVDFSAQRVNIGHAHPMLIEAVKRQIEEGGFDVGTPLRIVLAEKIKEIAPEGLSTGKVAFTTSGTSAAEKTIIMIRSFSRRRIIFACQGSYHGSSLGSLSLTMDRSQLRKGLYPMMPDVIHVPFANCYRCAYGQEYPGCGLRCVEYIRYVLDTVAHPEDIAAFFVEPIQTHGGIVIPPDEYFRKIRDICDEHKILLIDDEVVTGFGRTGKMFGIEHYGITPDILFMGKPIANGLDLGAIIGRKEVMTAYRGGTEGNPVSCASAIATIGIILNEKLAEKASKIGRYLMKRLREMQERHDIIGDVRGKGLLVGLELVKDRKRKTPATKETKEVVTGAYRNGLLMLVGGTYRQVLRLTPPLNITTKEIDHSVDKIERAFRESDL